MPSLENLSLRLVSFEDKGEKSTPRTVRVFKSEAGIRLNWSALEKRFASDSPYPTYKILPKNGTVEFDGFANKTGLFPPCVWGEGYFRLDTLLPLWIDPQYLNLDARTQERRPYQLGILNGGKIILQAAPDAVFERISLFQSLYNHLFVNGSLNRKLNFSKTEGKDLEKFQKDFFQVGVLSQTRADVIKDRKKISLPSKIIGNDYYHLIVLNDPQNPLILALRLFPENAPKVLRTHLEFFKKILEFRITQISD